MADLLVVFGDHVIIFSDKCCGFPDGDIGLAWSRWYRRAVRDSEKQLRRAEGWLRRCPDLIFADAKATDRLSFIIEPAAKMHLVAVAIGANEACRRYFDGGSGSLIVSGAATDRPFRIGDLDPTRPYVHVFDDVALDLVLGELDTVADFVDYLEKKEAFVRGGRFGGATGEEDLLAHYLSRIDETGRHGFVLDDQTGQILLGEGVWTRYRASSAYLRKKQADQPSYLWDRSIELLAKHVTQGTLVEGGEHSLAEHEEALRCMAAEPRLARRGLSRAFGDVGHDARDATLFARFVQGPASGPSYLFLRFAHEHGDYEEYRRNRLALLVAYLEVCKLRYPSVTRVVGLAFAPFDGEDGSLDHAVVDFSDWDEARAANARMIVERMGLLEAAQLTRTDVSEQEYPAPPSAASAFVKRPGKPVVADRKAQRKRKRKAQRAARRKHRR